MKDPYKKYANYYDTIFNRLNIGLRKIGIKMLPPKEGMSVLDIGCGTGAQLKLYQEQKCNVFGIDTSPSMLAIARKSLGEKAELHLGDAAKMPYPNNHFDLVLCSTVLHEMPSNVRSDVIKEIKRILKDKGFILFIDFHPGPLKTLKGWFYKSIITTAEILAGREHYKNCREFLNNGGLIKLIETHRLYIEKEKIVSGGNIAIELVRNI